MLTKNPTAAITPTADTANEYGTFEREDVWTDAPPSPSHAARVAPAVPPHGQRGLIGFSGFSGFGGSGGGAGGREVSVGGTSILAEGLINTGTRTEPAVAAASSAADASTTAAASTSITTTTTTTTTTTAAAAAAVALTAPSPNDPVWPPALPTAPYLLLATTFETLSSTTKRLTKADALRRLFAELLTRSPDDVLPAVYLTFGRCAEAHEGVELSVGGAAVSGCVREVTGKGLHSSTFRLKLSRFGHTSPSPPV